MSAESEGDVGRDWLGVEGVVVVEAMIDEGFGGSSGEAQRSIGAV
jgi:hypothetical protein